MTDLIERLLGIGPDSPVGALRREREQIRGNTEGAYRALLLPEEPGGVSRAERAAMAFRVARLEGDAALAGHFSGLIDDAAVRAAADAAVPSGAGPPRRC